MQPVRCADGQMIYLTPSVVIRVTSPPLIDDAGNYEERHIVQAVKNGHAHDVRAYATRAEAEQLRDRLAIRAAGRAA